MSDFELTMLALPCLEVWRVRQQQWVLFMRKMPSEAQPTAVVRGATKAQVGFKLGLRVD